MILVLKEGTDKQSVEHLCDWLTKAYGVQTSPIYGKSMTIVGLVGDTSNIPLDSLQMQHAVSRVMKVQEPYKRANRKFHPDDTEIQVKNLTIGRREIVVIAGPCSIESQEQVKSIAHAVSRSGAQLLRGGAFKPRTSPYSFQGLQEQGLDFMSEARQETGLPVVSEITNLNQLELFIDKVDIIQVGTRNMQNFELLKELGHVRKPVLLKRGFANSVDELLMSAEYIMSGGNDDVILCERGIRTFETSTRYTLDISAVPVLKTRTHLPVFVDPSHAAGYAYLVEPLAKAAVAAGVDGLIIEVHNDPPHALSDGPQSLTPDQFTGLMSRLEPVAQAVGRTLLPAGQDALNE